MGKITKRQKELTGNMIFEEVKKAFNQGWYKGQIALLEDQRKACLDSIDKGYKSFLHTGAIEVCNIRIKKRNEFLNSLNNRKSLKTPKKSEVQDGG